MGKRFSNLDIMFYEIYVYWDTELDCRIGFIPMERRGKDKIYGLNQNQEYIEIEKKTLSRIWERELVKKYKPLQNEAQRIKPTN